MVLVSAQCCHGPHVTSSCAILMLNPPGAELPQAKKSFVSAHRVPSVISNSLQPCGLWPARLLCGKGGVLCPHSRTTDQPSVGGHPREVSWTVTLSEGKDSDSSDSRKTLFLCFDLLCRFFWIFFSFFLFCFFPSFFFTPGCGNCQSYWHNETLLNF